MISRKKIRSFLRTPEIDDLLEKKIEKCEDLIQKNIQVRQVRKKVDKVDFFGPSKTLLDLEKEAQHLIFVGVTLGKEADVLLQKANLEDTSLAFVLDGVLSAYIEDYLDFMQKEDQEKTDLYITDRFSPGYGDIPHEMQKDFGDFLNIYKRLGVGLTKENIIIPRKTVLAVYGVSPKKPKYRNGCTFCSQETCKEKGKARCSVFDK